MLTAVLLIVARARRRRLAARASRSPPRSSALTETLPTALDRVDQWLRGIGLAHPLQTWLAQLHRNGGTLVSRFGGWLSTAGTASPIS